jgi:hypothetical protein
MRIEQREQDTCSFQCFLLKNLECESGTDLVKLSFPRREPLLFALKEHMIFF